MTNDTLNRVEKSVLCVAETHWKGISHWTARWLCMYYIDRGVFDGSEEASLTLKFTNDPPQFGNSLV